MDASSTPPLRVCFGQCISTADTALIRQCLELLKSHSEIGFTEVTGTDNDCNEQSAKGDGSNRLANTNTAGYINLSFLSEPLLAIRAIVSALLAIGRTREAETLDHVLYLCSEDRELGGHTISCTQLLTDADREKIVFLIDSWLYATAHEAANQAINTNVGISLQMRRPMTLSEKVFAHHMLPGTLSTGVKAGDVIRVSVDWILASEVSWTVSYSSRPGLHGLEELMYYY